MLFICAKCKEENFKEENKGIEILNHCIENLPKEVILCRSCSEKLAIDFMSGNFFSFLTLGKIFKKGN